MTERKKIFNLKIEFESGNKINGIHDDWDRVLKMLESCNRVKEVNISVEYWG